MKLRIKAQPNASRNEIVGFLGDELKIRVNALPESGKANRAIEELLARQLGLKKTQVKIISGLNKPRKVIEITGIIELQLREKLNL